MELLELENIWKECDRRIADNNRINKEILKKILIRKPERILTQMKIKTILSLLSPIILIAWIDITDYQFHDTLSFYIGIALFIPICTITYIWQLNYFLQIHTLDLSDKTLNIKRKMAILEKYKIKVTKIGYMLMPVAIVGALLTFCQRFVLNTEFIIMILLIAIISIASAYYRFRYSIRERFRILNNEIEEIERIEKE